MGAESKNDYVDGAGWAAGAPERWPAGLHPWGSGGELQAPPLALPFHHRKRREAQAGFYLIHTLPEAERKEWRGMETRSRQSSVTGGE